MRAAARFSSIPAANNDAPLVVRRYRHGGLWRSLTGERFFFSARRFLDELRIHLHLAALGLPLPEVLGVVVLSRPLFVGGFFVTRCLPGVISLADYFADCEQPQRLACGPASWVQDLARIHAAGVFYSDLHIRNILIRPADGAHFFIDFDKSRRQAEPLAPAQRRAQFLPFSSARWIKIAVGGAVSAVWNAAPCSMPMSPGRRPFSISMRR